MSVAPLDIVERAVTVLRNINAFGEVTVTELAKLSGVPRAAVNRYLVTWVNLGYVERDPSTLKYRVTPKVLEFSSGAPRDDWVTTHVRPLLVQTCKDIGWPLSLAMIRNSRLSVLDNTDAESPMIVYPMQEQIDLPLVGRSAGHVLLAYISTEVRADILKSALAADPHLFTRAQLDATQLDATQLDAALQKTRAQGYAATKVIGVNWATLSVPVKVKESVDFALSTRFHPTAVSNTDAVARFFDPLKQCAATLAEKLETVGPFT